ncbi:MAG: metallophosphoesterase [Acidilobaceae archaeon]
MRLNKILVVTQIFVLVLGVYASYAYTVGIAAIQEPYIVLPSYLLPAYLEPGSSFSVLVRSGSEIKVIEALVSSTRGLFKIEFDSSQGFIDLRVDPSYSLRVLVLRFKLPHNIPNGLYNLIIVTDTRLMWMPNSIIIDDMSGLRDSIRIAHLTDTHFGAEQGGYPNSFKHTRYITLLNTLVESYNIDIVVYTGDLVDVGSDILSYRDFFSVISQVLAPQLAITGNHDWAQVPDTRKLVKIYYGRYIVPLRVWNFTYRDFMFIGIDTRMVGYPEMWQIEELERIVSKSPDKTIIILMHHPIFREAGEYRGKPDDIRRFVYSSWRDRGWSQAVKFFEIIEKYHNIVAVLAGHIHRDADAIYYRSDGSKVYFITTTTANHGYPSGYYWGMKIIEVRRDGSVKVLIPSGRQYTPTSGSINTEALRVFEVRDKYSTAVSWFWNITGFNEISLANVTLVFYVNKSQQLNNYKLYGSTNYVHKMEVYDLGVYYLFKVYANLTRPGSLTIASYEDKVPPRVEILTPPIPTIGKPLVINAYVVDEGWGIRSVKALIKLNGRISSTIEAIRTTDPTLYRIVYTPRDYGNYEIIIQAVDLNNNIGEFKLSYSIMPPTETITKVETITKTNITETVTQEYLITQTSPTTTTQERGVTINYTSIAVILLIVILVVAGLIILRRR